MDEFAFWEKLWLNNFVSRSTDLLRPAGIIISHSLQMRVLLENTTFSLHKVVRIAEIIRGRALYEEIRYARLNNVNLNFDSVQ